MLSKLLFILDILRKKHFISSAAESLTSDDILDVVHDRNFPQFCSMNRSSKMANNRKQVMPLPGEVLGLPEGPCNITCPSCGATADSIVQKEITTFCHKASMWCFCIFGGCCSKSNTCQKMGQPGDLNHYCSKCGCFLGRYHPKDKSEGIMCHVYT